MSNVKSIEELFQELIELSAGQVRQDFLDRVCGDDTRLRQQLEGLARAHEQAGSFLRDDSIGETQDLGHVPTAGQSIGPYKLRELIGEGGMGSVYVAEQEKPLRRKVALKVIKPGMDSKAVLGRFEAERNALALMNHPNIAKVLDAGQTAQGHPYFVMELVNGVPITEYCDRQKLTVRERLNLFIDVCQAIQHAHQKGIIHRDIKPTNVLITELDGKPIAKVIDFGVAKALNQTLTEHSVYTAFQTIIGTPLYMSPEQASFSAVDVDTRSDVYSLGVLLYELLTGTTPFISSELTQAVGEEVFRLIRESEPPRPSNRISTLGKTAITVSQCRQTQPDQLGRTVKGDLDWIVMKALAKERGRRYRTSDALAEDVERFLKDAPIEARPDSITYRANRFYRRNRVAVVSATMILIAASVAFAMMIRQRAALRAANEILDVQQKHAVSLLEDNRLLIIERGLLKAFAGKPEEVDQISREYESVFGDDEEWPIILRAAAHWHVGEYSETQNLLRPVVEDSDAATLPAKALLASAYIYSGELDLGFQIANDLRATVPRDDYFDLDTLFLGYGLMFAEPRRANKLLGGVLERNPTWLFCHAMHCDSLIHLGRIEKSDETIDLGLRKSEALLQIAGDNPFALNVCLFGHIARIERLRAKGEPYDHLIAPSESLVERLSKHPTFIFAHAMPAQFYDVINRDAPAVDAWMRTLEHGGKMWRWFALGRISWDRSAEEMISLTESNRLPRNDLWLLVARACFLADTEWGQDDAIKIFERLITREDLSAIDRIKILQIPLVAHQRELAEATATRWLEQVNAGDLEDSESVFASNIDLLKIIASNDTFTPSVAGEPRYGFEQHMHGLIAYADKRFEAAHQHFQKASKRPWTGLQYYWSVRMRNRVEDKLRGLNEVN